MPDATAPQGAKQAHPLADPSEAARLLGALRAADPLTALKELEGWLDQARELPETAEKARNDILATLQDAAEPPVAAATREVNRSTASPGDSPGTAYTHS